MLARRFAEYISSNDLPIIDWYFAGVMPLGLTHTRASNATLTDATGATVWADANMVFPSVPDGGLKWAAAGSTQTVNSGLAPDGTTSATFFKDKTDSVTHSLVESINQAPFVAGLSYTFSVYLKAGTATVAQITGYSAAFGTSQYANFNLADGTLGNYTGNTTGKIPTITPVVGYAGWYRCTFHVTATTAVDGSAFVLFLTNNSLTAIRGPSYAGTETGVYVWGAQTEPTSYDSPHAYHPTTTEPYYAPRFDYDPVTHAIKGLLIEEQRTNLFLNSSAPVTQNITVTNAAHTLSFYGTGTITLSGARTAIVEGTGAYPSRKTLTFTPTAGALTLTLSGTITDPQLELGASATSFIPTYGAASTRATDVVSTTDLAWYNPNGGTFLVEFMPLAATQASTYPKILEVLKDSDNYLLMYSATGNSAFKYRNAGAGFDGSSGATPTAGIINKMAVTYVDGASASKAVINGGTVYTFTAAGMFSAPAQLSLFAGYSGANKNMGHIRSLRYWNVPQAATFMQKVTQ